MTSVPHESDRTLPAPGARNDAASPDHLTAGELIDGRYEIASVLGKGAMGVVYEAVDKDLERRVAIKLVSSAYAKLKGSYERFRTEAQTMARIQHPNVVSIHAFGRHNDSPFFVMELIDGTDLETWLRESARLPLPIDEVIFMMRAIGSGMQAIHAANATHGDLKPENILVDSSGRLVISDLGLARNVDPNQATHTLELAGTPAYMAPEILRMERIGPELMRRVDVYSLAVMAYELLTGSPPFDARNLVELLNMHATIAPPPPSSRRPELGAIADDVLLSALEKDPRLRTGSIEALVDGLARIGKAVRATIRIAVVDDDEDFLHLAQVMLESGIPGSVVEIHRNGASGLAAILASPPSAAVVDLRLPDLNGLELVAALRGELERYVPLVVVSAYGSAKDRALLEVLGAERFLAKPIEPELLVRTVRRLLGRSSLPPPGAR